MNSCLQYQAIQVRREGGIQISFRVQLLSAAVLLGALLLKVWVSIETTEVGYRLARERQYTIDLDMQRRELELELAVLQRPDSVLKRAQSIGLKNIDPLQARTIR